MKSTLGELCSLEGVDEEHGSGHGADAAGDGGDGAGDFFDGFEVDVSSEAVADALAGVIDAVRADIDDDGAWADHVGGDEVAAAGGGDEDVGFAGNGGEVRGAGVCDGDGGIGTGGFGGKHEGEWAADESGATDDDNVLAGGVDVGAEEQLLDPGGGGRDEARRSLDEEAEAGRAEAVGVFQRAEGGVDDDVVDGARDGFLDDDAIDVIIGVEVLDDGEKLVLGGGGWERLSGAGHADFSAVALLEPNVGGGGGIVADEDSGEVWRTASGGDEGGNLGGDFSADLCGDRVAIDNVGGHGGSMSRGRTREASPARHSCAGRQASRRRAVERGLRM
jgi:hypothetical protein